MALCAAHRLDLPFSFAPARPSITSPILAPNFPVRKSGSNLLFPPGRFESESPGPCGPRNPFVSKNARFDTTFPNRFGLEPRPNRKLLPRRLRSRQENQYTYRKNINSVTRNRMFLSFGEARAREVRPAGCCQAVPWGWLRCPARFRGEQPQVSDHHDQVSDGLQIRVE